MINSQAGSGGKGVQVKCANLDLLLVIPSSQMSQYVEGVQRSSIVTMPSSLIRKPGIHIPGLLRGLLTA